MCARESGASIVVAKLGTRVQTAAMTQRGTINDQFRDRAPNHSRSNNRGNSGGNCRLQKQLRTQGARQQQARPCPETPNIVTIGADVGVSRGTLLIASLVALLVVMRREKSRRGRVVGRAPDPAAEKQEMLTQMARRGKMPTDRVMELDA